MSDLDLLTDRLAIDDLFARYAHSADSYDADAWVGCFAKDGIFEVDAGRVGIQFVGRDALYEFVTAHIELLPGTRHVMTNHLVEIGGGSAQHRCTLTGMLSRPEKIYTYISGWYESTLVKVAGDWKIARRIVHGDYSANLAEEQLAAYLQPVGDWMAANGTIT